MENIDFKTNPNCKIEEKKFDWENYIIHTPQFSKRTLNKIYHFQNFRLNYLEKIILKRQLILLHNKLINHEEFSFIENLNEEVFNREHLIDLINKYIIINNRCNSPWIKYNLSVTEIDYINLLENMLDLKLNYVKEI